MKEFSKTARPYFDDILIVTRRKEGMNDEGLVKQHYEDVREVLLQLEKDRWVADEKKARLFMWSVEFSGHVLGGGKRRPAPGKLAAVQLWKPPRTVTELRGFLGVCNDYSGYVPMYAEKAGPIQEKLKGLPKEDAKAGSLSPL